MRTWTKILVVSTETSDPRPALEQALALARGASADITVLDVSEAAPESLRTSLPPDLLAKLETAARERRAAIVTTLVDEARRTGTPVRAKLETGSAFRVVVREALVERYDLVVKTVDAGSERSRSLHGSTDKHLLRKCPCALWLIAPADESRPSRVLAAVNPDPEDPEENALSEDILHAAAAAAETGGSELHVLHAWKVFGELLLRGPTPVVSDPEVDFIVGQTLSRHARYLDDLLERVAVTVPPHPHLVHARPADAIIDFVEKRSVTLLVIGTVGRTGIPGLLIGNTAERVLSEVACSVLALKPRGFLSPLALEP